MPNVAATTANPGQDKIMLIVTINVTMALEFCVSLSLQVAAGDRSNFMQFAAFG